MRGSATWCVTAGSSTKPTSRASPMDASSPAARRIELKLVDQIGGEEEALAWLAKEKNIDPKWPVRDWRLRPRFGDLDFLHLATAKVLDAAGLTALARRIEESAAVQAIERLNLDGLLALWHPSAPN